MRLLILCCLLAACVEMDIREQCASLTSEQKCHSEYEYGFSSTCNTVGTDGHMKFGAGYCMHNEEHCVPNPVYEYNRNVCMRLRD